MLPQENFENYLRAVRLNSVINYMPLNLLISHNFIILFGNIASYIIKEGWEFLPPLVTSSSSEHATECY